MTSLPLPLRGNNGGRPAGNGKKEGEVRLKFFHYMYANASERYGQKKKTGF